MGQAIGEEYTLVLAFKNFINYQDSEIVTNLSTSRMIDDISSGSIRTKIGEAHVVEKMKELNIDTTNQTLTSIRIFSIIYLFKNTAP